MPTRWILEQVGRKLRGHYAYYGVSGQHRGLVRFYREATKLLYKWLNRRSQRRSYKWAEFKQLLQRFPLPLPRVRVIYLSEPEMIVWGAVCVNCASTVLRGQEPTGERLK